VQKDDGSVTNTLENQVLSLNLRITESNLCKKPSYRWVFYISLDVFIQLRPILVHGFLLRVLELHFLRKTF
jgi:hypothetical protein